MASGLCVVSGFRLPKISNSSSSVKSCGLACLCCIKSVMAWSVIGLFKWCKNLLAARRASWIVDSLRYPLLLTLDCK